MRVVVCTLNAVLRTPLRIGVVLAGVALLSGCSSLQVAYTFAEGALESRAETYLDLDADQEAAVAAQAAAMIAWHRKAMLPKYAVFFREQADIAEAGGWTRPRIKAAFARFRALMDETVAGASPFVAEVLADHTTPQKLAYLEARMAERNAEHRTEHAEETLAEATDEWVERRVDRITRFTGTLTDAQVAIIRGYAPRGMDRALRWLDNREKRQGALVTFLRNAPTRPEIAGFVHRIVLRAHEVVDPDYRALSETRWALREDLYFDVLASLSDAQRRELAATLREYAADMTELAGV